MKKVAIFGYPIEHSKSPIIHKYWLNKYKIKGEYKKFSVEPKNLEKNIKDILKSGYQGANITIPHKETVLNYVDEISDRAYKIGAANTLVFRNGSIFADNTDGEGFINNIYEYVPNWMPENRIGLILGSGGATRAIIHSLLLKNMSKIFLTNRTYIRAEKIAHEFGPSISVINWQDINKYISQIDFLVNTTSLGMIGNSSLNINLSNLKPKTLVTDIVYNPLITNLLLDAKNYDCQIVDGLGMLLHQAVTGFEYWFGIRPEVDEILRSKIINTL